MRVSKLNFAKGEIAPELEARFDVDAYSAGVRQARNVRIRKYGGLEKRPGTRFVAEVFDATQPVRLMPFQFSFEQAYALELGQGYVRVAALGGMVLNPELAVAGIGTANPASFHVAYHGYAVGDQIYFTEQTGDWAFLNGRFWTIATVPDSDHFTLTGVSGVGRTFSGSTGGITNVAPPPSPPPSPPTPPPVDPPEPPDVGGGGREWRVPDYL